MHATDGSVKCPGRHRTLLHVDMEQNSQRCPPRPTQPASGELERLHSPLGLLFGRDQGASGNFRAELAAVREARRSRPTPADGSPPPAPDPPAATPGVATRWLRSLRSVFGRRSSG